MGLEKHGRISTYGLRPSTRYGFNQHLKAFDEDMVEMIRDELRYELREEIEEEIREEVLEELRVELREELREEIRGEIRAMVHEKFKRMQAQLDAIRIHMESTGIPMPSSHGQVLDSSSARQQQPCSSSLQHQVSSRNPLQELSQEQ